MKKGFTLIELMGVIIILSLLVLIAVPIVDKYVKQAKTEAGTAQVDSLIMAAKNWGSDNVDQLPENGKKIKVTLYTLMELGYLDYGISLNGLEVDGKNLSEYDSIQITNNNGKFKYELYLDQSVDNTAPVNLSMILVSSTINTLTVKAYAEDPESSVVRYDFNIDGEKDADGNILWEGGSGSRVHTFKNVQEGEHTVMFRAANSKNLQTESKKFKFSTMEVARLDFVVKNEPNNCTGARTIRIIYPAGSTNRSYKKDLGNIYTSTDSATVDVTTSYNCQPITAKADIEGVTIMATYNVKYKTINSSGKETICPCS